MPEDIVELEDEKQNRVRACQGCTTSLINQWTVYQRDQVPIDDRTYIYESPLGNNHREKKGLEVETAFSFF